MIDKIKNKTNKNNYAFIDAQNLYLAIKELGWKIDYKKFRIYLKEKYKVAYNKKTPHKDETS